MIHEICHRPNKSYFQDPPEFHSQVDTDKLVKKFSKQADKSIKTVERKVLKGTHLPLTVKETQAAYLISTYFRDIYFYLEQNKLPNTKEAIRKVETLAKRYILLDSLLFKLVTMPEKETALLAIPAIYVEKIISLYHSLSHLQSIKV